MRAWNTYETLHRKVLTDRIQSLEIVLAALLKQTMAILTEDGASLRQIKVEIARANNLLAQTQRVYAKRDI
jgi:hypothetical protein